LATNRIGRVRTIIAAQPEISGELRVFAGCDAARWKAELDRRLAAALGRPVEDWVLHDLRRTARSLMARVGVPRDHAERVLGHAMPGVEGIYDQHPYQAEMGEALKALANEVGRITGQAPGKAVHAAERRRAAG
jgi:integrase